MTATAAEDWKHWTEQRAASVSAPHGQLALTGTHWLAPEPGEVPGLPGRWWADGEGVRVRAAAADGVTVGGRPVDGEVLLRPDTDPAADTAALGDLLLVPIEREGELALRVLDPAAPRRVAFAGISSYPYAPEWAVPAVFTPFEGEPQAVVVPNADGRERPLAVTGRIEFTVAGEHRTLTVSRAGQRLSGVIADATSGVDTYRFRFITLPAPDPDGNTVLDLNRAYLPPCAFSDHFICPFPPPGNRLDFAVEAGERQVLSR
ncbi:DUF1684 domain-containing protein [Streptomyces rubellomurinus]|uniref:DUF1684 domain-containing protein n=1 Tax=Streptomyces rubellomurinus (strain ATCC 31215) TaxID=359131 RepID=A0A0F2T6D9_STRR3|nr:DUF1684 domain-containing protein [Streptomyces rubellomurinus]KJS57956.1 hypothetical protein VM95_36380 [Streptomyces rubellomurinus]